jgi:membrane associated rhomboid family serine protease
VIPLKDDNPTEITPFFTMILIAACVAVWVLIQGAGASEPRLVASVCELGAIPAELTGRAGQGGECRLGGLTWGALFSSMFLHGSWMHLIGNMWFLWIFGNNIEDSMGHLRFLAFYLLTGLAAAGAHVISDPSSTVPVVGASGAISGIMGAYLVLYPKARVLIPLIFGFFMRMTWLPAWLMLGYWFLVQALSAAATPAATGGGGVAFMAHIGGFVAGAALVKLFERRELVQAKRAHVKLDRRQIAHGGWY